MPLNVRLWLWLDIEQRKTPCATHLGGWRSGAAAPAGRWGTCPACPSAPRALTQQSAVQFSPWSAARPDQAVPLVGPPPLHHSTTASNTAQLFSPHSIFLLFAPDVENDRTFHHFIGDYEEGRGRAQSLLPGLPTSESHQGFQKNFYRLKGHASVNFTITSKYTFKQNDYHREQV